MAIETLFTTPAAAGPSAKLQTIFDGAIPGPAAPAAPAKKTATASAPFAGGAITRLNSDWIGSILSADDEIRRSLRTMRGRCRKLANNNDYVARFVNLVKQNVVGPHGIGLELQLPEGADELAEQTEEEFERAWAKWCKRKNCTTSGRMSFKEVCAVALETLVVDGEVFIRKVKGFEGNAFRFALQFLDADLFDETYNRVGRMVGDAWQNEIRMSIEVDPWGRPVAYYAFDGHPSEGHSRRTRIPADEIIHLYVIRRGNQTRGVPFLHSAMTRLDMLGKFEEAELVAARVAACKMAVITSKTGDEYKGEAGDTASTAAAGGPREMVAEPGGIEQLPVDMDIKPIDWTHPVVGVDEFVKVMLRGIASGVNASYASLTSDLREVSFASIRQGVLDERDSWRVLQTFASEGLCEPVVEAWVPMALVTNQLRVPLPPADDKDLYVDAIVWRPRGWTWVDPLKDVQAAISERRAGLGTLAAACAQRGLDWRDVIDQIAKENEYAKKRGVELDFSTAGQTVQDNSTDTTPAQPGRGRAGNEEGD